MKSRRNQNQVLADTVQMLSVAGVALCAALSILMLIAAMSETSNASIQETVSSIAGGN